MILPKRATSFLSFFSSLFSFDPSIFWLTIFSFSSVAVSDLVVFGLVLCLANIFAMLVLPLSLVTGLVVSVLTGEGFFTTVLENEASIPEPFLTESFFSSFFTIGSDLISCFTTGGALM